MISIAFHFFSVLETGPAMQSPVNGGIVSPSHLIIILIYMILCHVSFSKYFLSALKMLFCIISFSLNLYTIILLNAILHNFVEYNVGSFLLRLQAMLYVAKERVFILTRSFFGHSVDGELIACHIWIMAY